LRPKSGIIGIWPDSPNRDRGRTFERLCALMPNTLTYFGLVLKKGE
jgi:hypothetical protein